MKKIIGFLALLMVAPMSFAVSPYLLGEKLGAGDLGVVMEQVERKLQSEGFMVVGRHTPSGLPQHGTVVVTDAGILEAVNTAGGATIAGAAIRIGVKADGTVSYMNPDYWYRAYFRAKFDAAEPAVKAVQSKLAKALGEGAPFGGDVTPDDLPNYRYMIGMERFDSSKNELATFQSFEEAVKSVQDNLAKGVGEKVNAFYGRYRIALAWPSLGMGKFMGIVGAPGAIQETMTQVAVGKAAAKAN